jgi:hypothetical protein
MYGFDKVRYTEHKFHNTIKTVAFGNNSQIANLFFNFLYVNLQVSNRLSGFQRNVNSDFSQIACKSFADSVQRYIIAYLVRGSVQEKNRENPSTVGFEGYNGSNFRNKVFFSIDSRVNIGFTSEASSITNG